MSTSSTVTGTYRSSFLFKDAVLLSANSTNSSWFFSDVVDLNSDDRKDLIFFGATYPIGPATSEPRGSLFYWGSGQGTYSLATDRDIALPKTVHPREVVYADFNEDQVLDIFVADHGWDTHPFPGAQNQLLLSGPTGWILKTENLPTVSDYTHCAASGDVNNDGHIDIFIGNAPGPGSPATASLLLGNGKGQFLESKASLPSEIFGPLRFYAAELADLNADGLVDLIIGNSGAKYNSKTQSVVYWNNNGVFSDSRSYLLPNGYFGINNEHILDIKSADVDADGRSDLVILSTQNNPNYDGWSIQVLSNQPEGFIDITAKAFPQGTSYRGAPNELTGSPWIAFLKLVDLNGDGTVDILFDSIDNFKDKTPEKQVVRSGSANLNRLDKCNTGFFAEA